MIVIQILYAISAIGLALVGINALVLALIYLKHRHQHIRLPAVKDESAWPPVLVQLPIYNERYVVERLIESAGRLDYPHDRLRVQLLDDSTDETATIAAAAVERARTAGLQIEHVQRPSREGYKAGALAYGLEHDEAEFVAVFDADFVPEPDFLRRTIPYFLTDLRLGLVQARSGHLNLEHSLLTRAQAFALDSHLLIEQTARQRSGLFMNFSGTAGVWRRGCIDDSGGWQGDTLSEDIDLSYRAQLCGWHCLYLPDVEARAELPPLIMGFKRQQSRWATGTVQCLRKLGPELLVADLTIWQKVQAIIHLGGYLAFPLMIVLLLTALPLTLTGNLDSLPLAGLWLGLFGPPVQAVITQRTLYRDWPRKMLYFPMLMLVGIGIAVNNTQAVWKGLSGGQQTFLRTPKFQISGQRASWAESGYVLPIDHTTWLELLLAIYAAVTAAAALWLAPALAPFMALYAAGFAYVAGLGLWQSRTARRARMTVKREWLMADS